MRIAQIVTISFLASLVFFLTQTSLAQTQPVFLTSWKAYNFIPPGFSGKSLPLPRGTTVGVAFEILNDGKIIDVSKNNIKFFVNNQKRAEGIGLRGFRFATFDGQPGQTIKMVILNARDEIVYEHRFTIPTTKPEIVINHPYSLNLIDRGFNYFQALPYFFNIERIGDLVFNWTVNGAAPADTAENPDIIELDVPSEFSSGGNIAIQATAQNRVNQLEMALETINLTTR